MRTQKMTGVACLAGVILAGCASEQRVEEDTGVEVAGEAVVVADLPPVNRYATRLADAPVESGSAVEGMDGFYRAGRLIVGPQPSEADLLALRERGVGTVINLRSNAEVTDAERTPFDQPALLRELGMRSEHIALGGSDGYSPADVEAFGALMRSVDGDVLLHCASGGRARSMWQAWLISKRGYSAEEADAIARSLGQGPSALERLLGVSP